MNSRGLDARIYKLEHRSGRRECDLEDVRLASMSKAELHAELGDAIRELIEEHGFTPEQIEELEEAQR